MKKINLILGFCILVILAVLPVSAVNLIGEYDVIYNDTFDDSSNWALAGCSVSGGMLSCGGAGQNARFVHNITSFAISSNGGKGGAVQFDILFTLLGSDYAVRGMTLNDTSGVNAWGVYKSGANHIFHPPDEALTLPTATAERWTIVSQNNSEVDFYQDTDLDSVPTANGTMTSEMNIMLFGNTGGGNYAFTIDNFVVRNMTITIPLDSTHPTILLNNHLNNTRNNTIPLDIEFNVSDDSINSITCELSNSSSLLDYGTFMQSVDVNLTLAEGESILSQSFPNLNLSCFDNTELNNSATMILNITLDNIAPDITIITPKTGDEFNKNLTSSIDIAASCTDMPVYKLNSTITALNGSVVASYETIEYGESIMINNSLSITGLPEGGYSHIVYCADPHTAEISRDYLIKKRSSENMTELEYNTGDNRITISYKNQRSVSSFGTGKQRDKYKFWFITDNPNKDIESHTFEIISEKQVYYIPESPFIAHFVTGTNWIDFETEGISDYSVWLNKKGNYEVTIATSRSDLNFSSIGDLNIAQATASFTITSGLPPTDVIEYNTCVFTAGSTGKILLLISLLIISFAVLMFAVYIRHALVGVIGSSLLLIGSFYFYACISMVGLSISLLSFLLIYYFVNKGSKGQL